VASISNRSRFQVSVRGRPDLDARFPFEKKKDAQRHRDALRAQGFKASLSQAQDNILVRVRNQGYEDLTFFASSFAEADTAIARIESERKTGLFIDYTRAQDDFRQAHRAVHRGGMPQAQRLCHRDVHAEGLPRGQPQ
jgi:hypothetical protein